MRNGGLGGSHLDSLLLGVRRGDLGLLGLRLGQDGFNAGRAGFEGLVGLVMRC